MTTNRRAWVVRSGCGQGLLIVGQPGHRPVLLIIGRLGRGQTAI